MLSTLSIKNVVLIKSLNLACNNSFTTLTGETGAGKSILLDSLGLCLGMRAESRLVRQGEDKAQVTAMFHLPKNHIVFSILKDQDIELEGGEEDLILRRSLTNDGRSKAFINDQAVSLGTLRAVGDTLVEIHGQFDSHGLLDSKTHRGVLDSYAGCLEECEKVETLYRAWKDAENALLSAQEELSKSKEEEEFLRASVEDLEKLDPQENEESELTEKKNFLLNKSSVIDALKTADQLINGDGGAQLSIGQAWRALEKISDKGGEGLLSVKDALDRAHIETEEAASVLSSYLAEMEGQDGDLESIDDRLHALRGQARKFNCLANQLPEKLEELRQKLQDIYHQDDVLNDLVTTLEETKKAYEQVAQDLHEKRIKAAQNLDGAVNAELPPLKLEKAKFETQVIKREQDKWGVSGMDDVMFVVATNPGSAPGPLNKIASGGELSRFMLALKVVLADTGGADTLIFDEIDAGVGGATASAIGERLAKLAQKRQILVVTHSPQVAASASHHWIVSKAPDGDGAIHTQVTPLEEPANRREEIARMLAGSEITTEARAAADKLLEKTGS